MALGVNKLLINYIMFPFTASQVIIIFCPLMKEHCDHKFVVWG